MEGRNQSSDNDLRIKDVSYSNKIHSTTAEINNNQSSETNKEDEKINFNPNIRSVKNKWYTNCIHKFVSFFAKIITFILSIFTFCYRNTDDNTSDLKISNKNKDKGQPEMQREVSNDQFDSYQTNLKNIELNSEKQPLLNENNENEPLPNENQSILEKYSDDNYNLVNALFSNENDTNQAEIDETEIAVKSHVGQSSSEEINSNVVIEVRSIELSMSQNLIPNESIGSIENLLKEEVKEDTKSNESAVTGKIEKK